MFSRAARKAKQAKMQIDYLLYIQYKIQIHGHRIERQTSFPQDPMLSWKTPFKGMSSATCNLLYTFTEHAIVDQAKYVLPCIVIYHIASVLFAVWRMKEVC